MADSGAARRQRSEASAGRAPSPRAAGGRGTPRGSGSLDNLIHDRMRLGIVSALAVDESLTFNELKALLETTDGNLSVHARKLEEAEYVTCTKSFEGRVPRTEYRLTRSAAARSSGTSTTWRRSSAPRASADGPIFSPGRLSMQSTSSSDTRASTSP